MSDEKVISLNDRIRQAREREVLVDLKSVMQRDELTQQATAKEIGISATTLNQFLKGSYKGDVAATEAKIALWLDSYEQRRLHEAKLPDPPGFVETPTSSRITAALTYAQLAGVITVIYGAAGVGKTRTIEEFQAKNPNIWHATMSPDCATVVPALEEIALAVGLSELNVSGAARVRRAIVQRIRDTHGLLVIDEAHHLSALSLDAVRTLNDTTGIGLALVGNEQVYARMTGGNRAAYLDRLFSRIAKRVRLTGSKDADVDALINAWKLKDKSCVSVCREIAARPGGLRGLTYTLQLAAMFATGANRAMCCDDIRAAWRDLAGGES